MEQNLNFDNNNTPEATTPRVVRITKSRLAALRGLGYTRKQIAADYGITQQEVYQAMVEFGMVQARTERVNLPSYIIETVNDIADPVRDNVETPTEA